MSAPPKTTRTYHQLLTFLERESGRRLSLELNNNRVSYVSFEEVVPGGRVKVRLQRAFLSATEPVLRALARWIGSCRGRCPKSLNAFINSQAGKDPRPRRAPARISTRGRVHDLEEIAAEVDREYFRGKLELAVTWGRAVRRRRVHQRQLGTYDRERRLVTVSRVLDHAKVPRFFVAFVVFHEMLHAVQPDGEGRDHGPEFQAVERMHPDYRRAVLWQRRNLSLLMNPEGRRRRGRKRPGRGKDRDSGGPVQGVLF
jgi:hypothetical protein